MKSKKETKLNFFNFRISLLLWIIGIFLLPKIAYSSVITPQKLMELTNQERAKYELNLLTENPILTKAAEQKAQDILKQQKFSHNFSERKFSQWIRDEGYQYSIVGENLAINFITSEGLFNTWLASPAHKQNILYEDYQEVGVAVIEGNFVGENTILAVELFAAPAVMAEQLIPMLTNDSYSSSWTPRSFNTSNLAESYLTNIINNKDLEILPYLEPIELSTIAINKNKVFQYFSILIKLMAIYIAIMLLIILSCHYAIYLKKLIRKLGELPYPMKFKKTQNFTFYQRFTAKIE